MSNPNNQATKRNADVGRNAHDPGDIPMQGWVQISARVGREFSRHDMTVTGAGISFFALFGFFSAIAAFVAFYGLYSDPQTVVDNMKALRGFVPTDTVIAMIGHMHAVAAEPKPTLVCAGIFSLGVAIWCAQQGVAALMVALNTVYRETTPHRPWRHLFKSLFVAVEVIIGLMLSAALAIGLPLIVKALGGQLWLLELVRAVGMVLAGLCLFLGLAALYRWVPDRRPPHWRWAKAGATLVVGFWVVSSVLFSVFIAYSNSYTLMYGSLSAVVMLLTLTYVTVLTVLVGANFNAEMEHQTKRDTTVPGNRARGERGAYVADNVADSDHR